MNRRGFFKASALAGGAIGGLAAPAVAQTPPAVQWRCASGFDPSLATLYGAAVTVAEAVSQATGGRFEIAVSQAEQVDGPADTLDAVRSGAVDMLHTAPHYFVDRDPAFAFGSGLPFGLNQRLTSAWLHENGGLELFNQFLAGQGVLAIPAGNTGAQTGGWFNREINTVDDLEGVRFRIGGLGARIIENLGVVPVAVAPNDLVAAFETGALDAAEFAGPADDMALGLDRVARFLYYPGWWEGGAELMNMINLESWNELTPDYQAILRHASAQANILTLARYDVLNPAALQQLESSGTLIRPYSHDILEACFIAAEQTYRDISLQNAAFRALLESYLAFRRAGYGWFRRSQYAFDTYLMMLERGGRL